MVIRIPQSLYIGALAPVPLLAPAPPGYDTDIFEPCEPPGVSANAVKGTLSNSINASINEVILLNNDFIYRLLLIRNIIFIEEITVTETTLFKFF